MNPVSDAAAAFDAVDDVLSEYEESGESWDFAEIADAFQSIAGDLRVLLDSVQDLL